MATAFETFFDAWGETDAAAQAGAVASVFGEFGSYADPMTDAPLTGPDAVAAYIANFTRMAPGAVAQVVDEVARDGVARVTVEFRMPDGKAQPGQYFAELDADGRIARMVGFAGLGVPA